ncbi:MAG: hypothetical protein DME31_07090 [Verrucomicrobia bacterium]|nr:MAG: hypothetical protein DME31_07090 [Verrucomicrobiota bacterium]
MAFRTSDQLLSGATRSRFRRAAGASGLRGPGTPIARFLETPAHAIPLTHIICGAARLVFVRRLKRTEQTIL